MILRVRLIQSLETHNEDAAPASNALDIEAKDAKTTLDSPRL